MNDAARAVETDSLLGLGMEAGAPQPLSPIRRAARDFDAVESGSATLVDGDAVDGDRSGLKPGRFSAAP
jgi:hypothetical protein